MESPQKFVNFVWVAAAAGAVVQKQKPVLLLLLSCCCCCYYVAAQDIDIFISPKYVAALLIQHFIGIASG